jgi:hypothetical protein
MREPFAAAAVALFLAAWSPAGAQSPTPESVGKAVEELTGSRTRLVWTRDGGLVFLDTRDGKGEVERSYGRKASRPVLTSRGDRVVFICFDDWHSYIANWGAETAAELVDGRVTHVRGDESGAEWAYWQTRSNEIRTARLDRITESTVVWRFPFPPREGKTECWQTSADGKRAAASIPWPQIGSAVLPRTEGHDFARYGIGCWPQIARDNSYRVFHLRGGRHDRLAVYNAQGTEAWFVKCLPNPRRSGCENPRWANDPRIVVGTDQHWQDLLPDIYVGKFSGDFSRMERWVRVTDRGDNGEPDCWIEASAAYPAAARPGSDLVEARGIRSGWPPDRRSLAFLWEDLAAENVVADERGKEKRRCLAVLKGMARPYHYGVVDLTGGSLVTEGLDESLVREFRNGQGFTFEAVLTPLAQGDGTIAAFGPVEGPCNFAIEQRGTSVAVCARAEGEGPSNGVWRADLGPLAGKETRGQWQGAASQHVMVACASDTATLFVDGDRVGQARGGPSDFGRWQTGPLVFGADVAGTNGWSGRIEGIALYARAMTPEDAGRHAGMYAMKLAARGEARLRRCRGHLVEITPAPTLAQIQPYPRALVVYAYDVDVWQEGRRSTERIHVAHWAWLDSRPVPRDRKVGETYSLLIEPFNVSRNMESERLVSSLTDPGPRLYLDVGR